MKNQKFYLRLRYALKGIRATFKLESSFRTQCYFAIAAFFLLLILRPKPLWWALVTLTIASVLAAEAINTSIESILDRIHPEANPTIGRAKDCAAGAVLILSLASLGVCAAMVWDFFY